jgi:hypothetical protein
LWNEPCFWDPESIEEGTVAYMSGRSIEQVGYQDAIEVRTPDPAETRFFNLLTDGRIQVIEIFRVAFDQHQNRLRLPVTVYRVDQIRFIIDGGGTPISRSLLPGADGNGEHTNRSLSS